MRHVRRRRIAEPDLPPGPHRDCLDEHVLQNIGLAPEAQLDAKVPKLLTCRLRLRQLLPIPVDARTQHDLPMLILCPLGFFCVVGA